VFFEDQDRNSGSGQKEPQHHAGGTAAGNATSDRKLAPLQPIFSLRA
jgi:hypothetical protein